VNVEGKEQQLKRTALDPLFSLCSHLYASVSLKYLSLSLYYVCVYVFLKGRIPVERRERRERTLLDLFLFWISVLSPCVRLAFEVNAVR
jgi:hypothetical protein